MTAPTAGGAALPLRERAASNASTKLSTDEGEGSWFEGVVLCVSGLMWNDRERAVATVCQGGGAYSGSLHKGCTHLAVLAPEVSARAHTLLFFLDEKRFFYLASNLDSYTPCGETTTTAPH